MAKRANAPGAAGNGRMPVSVEVRMRPHAARRPGERGQVTEYLILLEALGPPRPGQVLKGARAPSDNRRRKRRKNGPDCIPQGPRKYAEVVLPLPE